MKCSLILSFALFLTLSLGFVVSANASEATVKDDLATLPIEAESEATIQVKPVVEVDGTSHEITFGDVIVTHGVSDELLGSIRLLRLADMPKPGESRSFTAIGIEEVFRPQLRSIEARLGEKVVLKVPNRVTITRKVFRLRNEDVQAELKTQLRSLCGDCQFEITDLKVPVLTQTLSTATTWTLKMRPELPKGNFSMPLEVKNEDGSKRTYWVSGTVKIMKTVAIAKRMIGFGEKLRAEDFAMEVKDITFALDGTATQVDLESSVASRQVAVGQIIYRSALKREMAVKVGEMVKVESGGDTWLISIDGIAQNAAYIGDTVNVKIPRTQKLISGMLRERGVVEVR